MTSKRSCAMLSDMTLGSRKMLFLSLYSISFLCFLNVFSIPFHNTSTNSTHEELPLWFYDWYYHWPFSRSFHVFVSAYTYSSNSKQRTFCPCILCSYAFDWKIFECLTQCFALHVPCYDAFTRFEFLGNFSCKGIMNEWGLICDDVSSYRIRHE